MLSYYKLSQTHQNTEQHQTLPVGSHTHTSMSHFLCWSHEVNVLKLNPQRHTTDHTAWKQEQSLCVCVASSSDLRWTWEVCVCVLHCEGLSRTVSQPYPIPACTVRAICCVRGSAVSSKRPWKPDHKPPDPPHSHDQRDENRKLLS